MNKNVSKKILKELLDKWDELDDDYIYRHLTYVYYWIDEIEDLENV